MKPSPPVPLTRLERAALNVVIPDPNALDGGAFDRTDLECLAHIAKAWLLTIGISPELRAELLGSAGRDPLAVIATATEIARNRGQAWPWRQYLDVCPPILNRIRP